MEDNPKPESIKGGCSPEELVGILKNIKTIQFSEDESINFSFSPEEIEKILVNENISFALKFSSHLLEKIIPERIKINLINLGLTDEKSAERWKKALIKLPQLLYLNPDLILNNIKAVSDRESYIEKALEEPELFLRYPQK